MPEICLGVLAARRGILPGKAAGLAGCAALVAGSVHAVLWPLTFVGALLAALWIYRVLAPRLREQPFLQRLGAWSMAIFLVNGFVRMPFVAIGLEKSWIYGLILGIVSMAAAVTVARLLCVCESRFRLAMDSWLGRPGV